MANKYIDGDVEVSFTQSQSRQSLESGESVKTLFGKLRKWLSDLKPVAFSGSYLDLDNKPTVVNNVVYDPANKSLRKTKDGLASTIVSISTIKTDMELDNVGNFKAVSTVALQNLTDTEKSNARTNMGLNSAATYPHSSFATATQGGYATDFNSNFKPIFSTSGQSHASIFRGKYLGSSFTSAQKAAIADGTFDDLFVGDYWAINNVNWRIADIDYFFNFGDTKCLTHHLVIVPDYQITTGKMNSSNSTNTAYTSSYMRATILQQNGNESSSSVLGKIKAAFGSSYILSHRSILCNGTSGGSPSSWAWYDSKVDLLNQCMVYGSSVWESASNNGMSLGIETSQFQLFKLARQFVMNMSGTSSNGYWLRDIYNAECFCYVASNGTAHALYGQASGTMGVRPYFCLKGA